MKPHRPSHAALTCVMRKGGRASVTTRAWADGCSAASSVRGIAAKISSLKNQKKELREMEGSGRKANEESRWIYEERG